uniref:ATP synthase F0 subunit 8 n=1 Tax=Pseudaphritis urvillii TaxID=56722 RepID=UPI0026E23790|nr:ATP synthase F0 subunit 8 [Pseudaphritis urvillii]WJQ22704.1 ATP synthase F0 subunit 8 [Pseudaphritis urvillii]
MPRPSAISIFVSTLFGVMFCMFHGHYKVARSMFEPAPEKKPFFNWKKLDCPWF